VQQIQEVRRVTADPVGSAIRREHSTAHGLELAWSLVTGKQERRRLADQLIGAPADEMAQPLAHIQQMRVADGRAEQHHGHAVDRLLGLDRGLPERLGADEHDVGIRYQVIGRRVGTGQIGV